MGNSKVSVNFEAAFTQANTSPPEILECTEPKVLEFPLHIYPNLLQNIVRECHQALQFPIDFIATGMISATAASFGNHYHIKVREQHTEPAVFYICIAGSPGVTKSPALDWLLKPLSKRDSIRYDDYQIQMQKYEEIQNLKPTERKSRQITGKQEKPVHKVSILKDFTLESLIATHHDNSKGLLVYADEILSWIGNFNRYSKGQDEPYWLSMWTGQSISLKRKTSAYNFVKQTNVNVIGGIQINRLRELSSDSRMKNGFIERLLFCIPDIEKKAWDIDKQFDKYLADSYDKYIGSLCDLAYDEEPLFIEFNTEARKLLFAWQAENTVNVNINKDNMLGNILSKWECYFVRFALVLQVMHDTCNSKEILQIETPAVKGAILLHSYFVNHTQKVINLIDQPAELDGLTTWKKKLLKAFQEEFTTAEALALHKKLNVSERSINDFLTNRKLFDKLSQGHYRVKV